MIYLILGLFVIYVLGFIYLREDFLLMEINKKEDKKIKKSVKK